MKMYRLGRIGWRESQSFYHVLAERGEEAVVLCHPDSPHLCLGFHDDWEQEVDEDACRELGLGLIRREAGGGLVLLDERQAYFQVIWQRRNPKLPRRREAGFRQVLQAPLQVLAKLGVPGELIAPADLAVKGRKISGNGAGDIGESTVYIGNLLGDFNRQMMVDALKMPDAVFKKRVADAMVERLVTLRELGVCAAVEEVEELLVEAFQDVLGTMEKGVLTPELQEAARRRGEELTAREFLELPGRRYPFRQIKIQEGLFLRHYTCSWGGTLRLQLRRGKPEKLVFAGLPGCNLAQEKQLAAQLAQEGIASLTAWQGILPEPCRRELKTLWAADWP